MKLLGASTLSQFLPIIILPLLTSNLDLGAFGYLGSFMSLVLIVSIVLTLRFEPSIVLCGEEGKEQSENVRTITLYTSFLVGLVLVLYSFFSSIPFQILFCFLLSVFCFSANKIVEQYLTSTESYSKISRNKVTLVFFTSICHLFVAYQIGEGEYLLVYSYTFSVFLCSVYFLYSSGLRLVPNMKLSSKELLARYSKFGKFEMPSDLILQLSQSLPVVIVMSVFGAEKAGLYSLAEKIVLLPVFMIGSTLGMVYYREMSKAKSQESEAREAKRIINGLLSLTLIGFLSYFLLFDFLVNGFFDDNYSDLSKYSDYLILYGIVLFVSSPLTGAVWKAGKQKVNLTISIITFVVRCLIFYLVAINFNFETSLLFLVLASILPRLTLLCFCMKVLSLKMHEVIVYTTLLVFLVIVAYYVLMPTIT